MCYLVRQQQAAAPTTGSTPVAPGPERLRPRWIGAGAALLAGGLALAAALVVPNTPPTAAAPPEAGAPLAARTGSVPAKLAAEPAAGLVDDGVPAALDSRKDAVGHCGHGL